MQTKKGHFGNLILLLNNVGKQRLPEHSGLSNLLGMSPSYSLFNSQVTEFFLKNLKFIWGENLGNYTQKLQF